MILKKIYLYIENKKDAPDEASFNIFFLVY